VAGPATPGAHSGRPSDARRTRCGILATADAHAAIVCDLDVALATTKAHEPATCALTVAVHDSSVAAATGNRRTHCGYLRRPTHTQRLCATPMSLWRRPKPTNPQRARSPSLSTTASVHDARRTQRPDLPTPGGQTYQHPTHTLRILAAADAHATTVRDPDVALATAQAHESKTCALTVAVHDSRCPRRQAREQPQCSPCGARISGSRDSGFARSSPWSSRPVTAPAKWYSPGPAGRSAHGKSARSRAVRVSSTAAGSTPEPGRSPNQGMEWLGP
jgi:hypothetical protein